MILGYADPLWRWNGAAALLNTHTGSSDGRRKPECTTPILCRPMGGARTRAYPLADLLMALSVVVWTTLQRVSGAA